MTKYKGKYKSSSGLASQNRKRMMHASLMWAGLTLGLGGVVFGCVRLGDVVISPRMATTQMASAVENVETGVKLPKNRLNREVIPSVNFGRCSYGRTFCDMNEEQLIAAKRNGIKDLSRVDEMIALGELYELTPNSLYVIDSLTHSQPYMVEAGALMLNYIGMRFQEVLADKDRDNHGYRLVVTSVLRSPKDVARLRRTNRNASENSCHVYGTTIDISYIRYLRDDGEVVNELWLKEALAQALYELRYEGICYVRYEYRQGCFHITVRDTEYKGNLASTMHYYDESNGIQPELLAFLTEENEEDLMIEESEEAIEEEEGWWDLRKERRERIKEQKEMKKMLARVEPKKHKKEDKRKENIVETEDVVELQQEVKIQELKPVEYNKKEQRDNYVSYPNQPNMNDIRSKQVKMNEEKRNSTYVSEYVGF